MKVKLIAAWGPNSCPECGGSHTVYEHNVMGHAVNCALKPETIVSELLDGLKEISEMSPELLAADANELAARLIEECPAVVNR
jgi:hypothetical protein